MSLAEQVQRVDGSQNEILKSFLAAFGVTVGPNKIDQLATLAKAAPLLKENGILAGDTKTSLGLSADATVNDVFAKFSKAALVGEDGSLTDIKGGKVTPSKVEYGTYLGTGTGGDTSPNSISFSGRPAVVAVYASGVGQYGFGLFFPHFYGEDYGDDYAYSCESDTGLKKEERTKAKFDSSTNTLYWYAYGNSGPTYPTTNLKPQLNTKNKEYKYVGIII